MAKNARSDQTEVEFNPSSIGGQDDPRVNAENQTEESKDQEASRCRSQAGQAAGEAGIGGAGREEGKGEERKGEKRKGAKRRKGEKREDQEGKVNEVKLAKEELGRQAAKKISACAGKKGAL